MSRVLRSIIVHNHEMLGELMQREILEQPVILARECDSYVEQARDAIGDGDYELVVLVARGSSDNAALISRYWFEIFTGLPVSLAAPSVLTRFNRRVKYPPSLAIGISQSGAAPDVAEVLCAMREDGHRTVAITNTPGSRVTEEADASILLNAGPELSVAATKTYSASLLALYQLVRALCSRQMARADAESDPTNQLPTLDWCNSARAAAEMASGVVVRSSPVFALGRGYAFGTAHEAALKLMECALVPVKAYSSADFEHGPKALAGHGSAAISFDGPKLDLAGQGCQIVTVPQPPAPEPLRPLWDAFFGQWLALTVARARGLNPDDPQHLKKVTKTL